jgi:3-oxoacyl-[acyl-carrier-protein] synthase-3
MLRHLAKKSKLPADKVPVNIDRFGNTSSATIPLLMTSNLADRLRGGPVRLGLFGFGVGFSWGSADISVGPLACAETIEYR